MSFPRNAAILGGLLVAQSALIAWTWRSPSSAEMAPRRLLPVDAARVDAIVVVPRSDVPPQPPPVRLEKREGQWVIATAGGYPADPARMANILRGLVEAEVRGPVATTAASHAALEVGAESFQRKVEVHAGTETVTVFLGTTTTGTANVRLDGADEVYTLRDLTVFDLGPEARTFAAPAVLDLDAARAVSLSVRNPRGTFTLRQDGGIWSSDVSVDAKKAASFVRKATKLRLVTPVGTTRDPAYGLDGSTHVAWTMVDGTVGGYTAGKLDGAEAWLQLDDSPFVVRVPVLPITAVENVTIGDLAP